MIPLTVLAAGVAKQARLRFGGRAKAKNKATRIYQPKAPIFLAHHSAIPSGSAN